MRPKDAIQFQIKMAEAGLSVLWKGPPGVGKTSIVEQAAEQGGFDLIYTDCATSDNTRAEGMPWIDPAKGEAMFFPFGDLAKALSATKKTIWLLDDLGWAMISVQNSWAHLIHEKRTPSGKELPSHVSIVATTNERTHKAGVGGFSEPVKSRFCSIVPFVVNQEDWCDEILTNYQARYRLTEEAAIDGVSFVRFKGIDGLHKFEPTADLTNSVCPRTVVNALKICSLGLPPHQELEGCQGAAGEGWTAMFMGFRRLRQELPSMDQILLNPDTAPIPANTSALWAVSIGLAAKATVKNFARVARYAERLYDSKHGEFCTVLLKECTKLNSPITNTHAFIKLLSGPVGQLLNGDMA